MLLVVLAIMERQSFGQTTSFTYQGHLIDAGTAANGNYDFQFALWDSLTNGNQVGSTQSLNAVSVNNGVFTVSLDFGANAFPGANRFLEIRTRRTGIATFTILDPRQQVTATPYSVRSVNASSADTLSTACAGCVQNSQINSVAGSKVTGTVGSATNVTGVVAVANGGTGSSVKNFVDLNGNQIINGTKTFTGNVGIGITTPVGQLHVNGGSSLTFTRTSGRSPVFAAGTGENNEEFIMGYVTQADDYVAFSQAGDSFLFPSNNAGKTYLGRISGNLPLMTLDNGVGTVGIGSTHSGTKLNVEAGNLAGVRAISVESAAVIAQSTNNSGVSASSVNGTGVSGISFGGGAGVVGASTTNGVGVRATSVSGNIIEGYTSGPTLRFMVQNNGTVRAPDYQGLPDFAEEIRPSPANKSRLEPGDVLVAASDIDRGVTRSRKPYSTSVLGVYSTAPGFIGTEHPLEGASSETIPMAVIGIVPAKVSAENGPIKRGDLLTTSRTPGHAMRCANRRRCSGAIVGKALANWDRGTGVIKVLVSLQ